MSRARPGILLRGYSILTAVAAPVLHWAALRRMARRGVPPERCRERLGHATAPRPTGRVLWFHAASVGESLSLLGLLSELLARSPDLSAVVTSGTPTSAELLADRLPARAVHQYPPFDTPAPVRRFLDHWRPDLAIFVESEIWPRQIAAAHARRIPLALVNARLSKTSLANWARDPRTAAHVFGKFTRIVAQDTRTRDGLTRFLPDDAPVALGGNLKAAAAAPDADPEKVSRWTTLLGDRPVWVASSTHPGEDDPVLSAHRAVLGRRPNALCILAPRHPDRGAVVADMARDRGFITARRGAGEDADARTQVYIADTMGEMGLWYRVAPLVFLAGSFGDAGGHNPWEPIGAGAALLHGPNVTNAAADYRRLDQAGAALEVTPETLGPTLLRLLDDPAERDALHAAASEMAGPGDEMVRTLATDLLTLMEPAHAS